jgi:hypothetical protein
MRCLSERRLKTGDDLLSPVGHGVAGTGAADNRGTVSWCAAPNLRHIALGNY